MTKAAYVPMGRPAPLAGDAEVAAMLAKLKAKVAVKVDVPYIPPPRPPPPTPTKPRVELTWVRAGEYAMRTPDGKWTVAKTLHSGSALYTVWRMTPGSEWFTPVGPPHDSFTKARDYATTVANQ